MSRPKFKSPLPFESRDQAGPVTPCSRPEPEHRVLTANENEPGICPLHPSLLASPRLSCFPSSVLHHAAGTASFHFLSSFSS